MQGEKKFAPRTRLTAGVFLSPLLDELSYKLWRLRHDLTEKERLWVRDRINHIVEVNLAPKK